MIILDDSFFRGTIMFDRKLPPSVNSRPSELYTHFRDTFSPAFCNDPNPSISIYDHLSSISLRQVLSVIAQQIMTLQGAVQRGEKRVVFEDVGVLSSRSFSSKEAVEPTH